MKQFGEIIDETNQQTIYYGSIGTALFLSSRMLTTPVNSYTNEVTTLGKYTVIYEVDSRAEAAIIMIKENQTELKLKGMFVGASQAWLSLDDVASLRNKEGHPLNSENVIVEDNVSTQKVDLYFVTFRYESCPSITKVHVNPINFTTERSMLAELPYSQAMTGSERPITASRQGREQQTRQEKKRNKIRRKQANKKVLLNGEPLEKIDTIAPVEITGGTASESSQFGTTLSFLPGSSLHRTRRI